MTSISEMISAITGGVVAVILFYAFYTIFTVGKVVYLSIFDNGKQEEKNGLTTNKSKEGR